jgi:hypothetical protein
MAAQEKPSKAQVTINIAMPKDLHRRLAIATAAMDVSLKDAVIAGAALWVEAHSGEIAAAVAAANVTPKNAGRRPASKTADAPSSIVVPDAQSPK